MRSDAPALLPILRSRHLAEILTLLLLHPDTEYSLSELAATLGLPLTTVQREAARLTAAGLIGERRVGRARLVFADPTVTVIAASRSRWAGSRMGGAG
ncbi:MAG: hypothetical protein ABSF03_31530 [Streptosporangiaceae bacterium]|jgi:DNA-binding transcriptional ArsR family regulator